VNPQLKHKGLAVVYNPLNSAAERRLKLPLYYTGLTTAARIREQEGKAGRYPLDRQYQVEVPLKVPPRSMTWLVIE
jgi:hypothetical protein